MGSAADLSNLHESERSARVAEDVGVAGRLLESERGELVRRRNARLKYENKGRQPRGGGAHEDRRDVVQVGVLLEQGDVGLARLPDRVARHGLLERHRLEVAELDALGRSLA